MRVLGIDTAHRNLGLAVITADRSKVQVVMAETFRPPEDSDGIFMPALHCAKRLRAVLKEYPVDFATLEGAALNQREGMVSIGAVHGTLAQVLVDARIPFVYPPPNKMKLFATADGSAEKKDIKELVEKVFGKMKPRLDSNRADALALALMAVWFGHAAHGGVEEAMQFLPRSLPPKEVLRAFTAEKPLNKKKEKPGILHRRNVMFWIPQEKKEVFHVSVGGRKGADGSGEAGPSGVVGALTELPPDPTNGGVQHRVPMD